MPDRFQKLLTLLSRFKESEIDKQIDYEKFYLYSLITHSTAIEGSTVTEIENQLLFDEGITAKGRSILEQLMNLDLKAAYEQSLAYAKERSDISVDMLKHLSALVMKNTGTVYKTALGDFSSSNGDLRLLNVTAGMGGSSYMNYAKVPQKLKEFCEELNIHRHALSCQDIIKAYQLSFDAHYQLVTIHPWADGNGRMSRLLMNQLQFEFGLITVNIQKNSKADYINALIATRENDDLNIFRDFMFDEHIRNLGKMLHDYQLSIDDDNVGVMMESNRSDELNKPNDELTDELNSGQKIVFQFIANNPDCQAKDISCQLNMPFGTVDRHVRVLIHKNLIERRGSKKTGGYWKRESY